MPISLSRSFVFTALAAVLPLLSSPAFAQTAASEAAQAPVLQGVLLLGNSPISVHQVAPYYQALIGQPAGDGVLEQLRQAVARAHDEAGWGLVSVDTPRLMGGTAVVRAQALWLSRVAVAGGEPAVPVDALEVSAVLPGLQVGQPLNLNAIDAQLRLAQWQPNRRWEIDFQPDDALPPAARQSTRSAPFAPTPGRGLADGMTAPPPPQGAPRVAPSSRQPGQGLLAKVWVSEASPWFGRWILDNAGQPATGRERARVQVGHADLFGPGRSLDLSALVSLENPDRQHQLALRYQHPLPRWATLVTAEFSQSRSRTGVVSDFFDVSGQSHGGVLTAKRVLPRMGALEPHVEWGLEASLHDDVIDFFGTNLGSKVGIAPLNLALGGTWQSGVWRAFGQLRWRHNEGWGPSAAQADYQAARFGAKRRWDALDLALDLRVGTGAGREAGLRVLGQLSPGALVSPAQFRVGGSQAMRGLQEGELAGDSGLALALEHWWTPAQGHRLGVLLDAARAVRHRALANEAQALASTSIGLGWQWQIVPGWQLHTTAAHVVSAHSLNVSSRGDTRLHLALDGSF